MAARVWVGAGIGGSLLLVGLLLRAPLVTLSPYWRWPWRTDTSLVATAAHCLPALLLVAGALRAMAADRRRLALGLLCAAQLALTWGAHVGGIERDRDALRWLELIVRHEDATSYWTDAERIDARGGVARWLATYDPGSLAFHSTTKPPGPVLLYYAARRVAGERGPLLGALWISLLGALGPLGVYGVARLLCAPRESLMAAALYALAPAPALFLPSLDPCYVPAAAAMLVCWVAALRSDDWRAPAALGLTFFAAFFFAYNLLPLGGLLGALALREWWVATERPAQAARTVRASGIALAVWLGGDALLYLATGFDALAAFRGSLAAQASHAAGYGRTWLACAVFDPVDFFRGAGFVLVVPALAAWVALRDHPERWLGRAMLAFVVLIDLSGLLRAETMRVWMFCLPLVIAPAVVALGRASTRAWAGLLVLQWATVVAMRARLGFVGYGGG